MSMIISAGIAIIYRGKILLGHPTNAPWTGMLSIPKGQREEDEELIETAIRETREEVGLTILASQVTNLSSPLEIVYTSQKGKRYKKIFVFHCPISSLEEIGLSAEVLDQKQLQLEEVDWAGFLDYTSAKEKIFWRQDPILGFIQNDES